MSQNLRKLIPILTYLISHTIKVFNSIEKKKKRKKLDKTIEDYSKFGEVTLQDGVIHPATQKQFDSIFHQKISEKG